jgi:hypothetical protein
MHSIRMFSFSKNVITKLHVNKNNYKSDAIQKKEVKSITYASLKRDFSMIENQSRQKNPSIYIFLMLHI